jgi:protease-4
VLGGLETTIKIAADRIKAGEDYRVVYYPAQKKWFETLMEDFGNNVKASWIKAELGDVYPTYVKVQKLKNYKGVQVRMPQNIVIQ